MSATTMTRGTHRSRRCGWRRTGWHRALPFLLALGSLAGPRSAHGAEPAPLDARVVWVRPPSAYVASRDSLALAPFMRLTFTSKGKPVASGEVERLVDAGMAVVRITSGSLPDAKRLDRLRVVVEPPNAPRLLRVGFPSEKRPDPLSPCARLRFDPPLAPATFRLEVVEGVERGVRVTAEPGVAWDISWPETLVVRIFDDAADQEIALERGEIDLAVFRPAELSPHMRDHPRWKDAASAPAPGAAGTAPTAAPREHQVLCEPRLRPWTASVGASTFVHLFACEADGGKP